MLPHFLIIGCQKGGTTSASVNLSQHPQVACYPREVHFFDLNKNWRRGPGWYENKFKAMRVKHPKIVAGEKSPGYFFYTRSYPRMQQIVPNAKLILILRDPVQRAISQWNMVNRNRTLNKGNPPLNIDALFLKSLARFKGNSWQGIINRGVYVWRLQQLHTFFPKNQIYVTITERVKANKDEEYNKMFEFLGVSPFNGMKYKEHNCSQNKVYPKESVMKAMYDFYKPRNEHLFSFLGYRVPEWDMNYGLSTVPL